MVNIKDRPAKQRARSGANRPTHEHSSNVVNLSDHTPQGPTPVTTTEDLEAQVLNHRGLAIEQIDSAIQRLMSLQGTSIPATGDGIAALQSARRILSNLDVDAPDFGDRLNFLAIQLDLLAKCLWQVAMTQSLTLPDAAAPNGDAGDGRPAEE